MARKHDNTLIIWLILIGGPIFIVMQIAESIGIWTTITGIVLLVFGIFYHSYHNDKKRMEYLLKKYKDEELAQEIFDGKFWQGQTSSQLIDSIGRPADIDEKILKTKKKEIWKYDHQGGNRYNLRITLENDVVVGWDKK